MDRTKINLLVCTTYHGGKQWESKAFVKAELPMEEADHAYSGSIAGNPASNHPDEIVPRAVGNPSNSTVIVIVIGCGRWHPR